MADMKKKKKKKRRNNNRRGERRKDNDPLHAHDGSGVTLDGVATATADDNVDSVNNDENNVDDSEYFDGDGIVEDDNAMDDEDNKRQKIDRDTYDEGMGKSTAGRQRWKERHNKGMYSNKKSRTGKNKNRDGQFFT